MNGRTGGKTNSERDGSQDVAFHPDNARELAQYLLPHYDRQKDAWPAVLDACSGDGVLGAAFSRELKALGYKPVLFEAEKKNGFDVMDLPAGEKFDVIVCNPPWALEQALPIYHHLENLLTKDGVMFFIINNVFCYQGSDRAECLSYQKYYFLPRWTFKPAGRPLLDCGVMVNHKNGDMTREAAALRPYVKLNRVLLENVIKETDVEKREQDCAIEEVKNGLE